MSQRFEMRLSDELMGRLDGARGETPRATFIKRALESALDREDETGAVRRSPVEFSTSPPVGRGSTRGQSKGEPVAPVSASTRASAEPYELPKIAKRRAR